MLLRPEEAHLFFKLHSSLMCFVNERLEIVPGAQDPDAYRTLSADLRLKTRNALLNNMDLVEMFVDLNPFKFSGEDLNIVCRSGRCCNRSGAAARSWIRSGM